MTFYYQRENNICQYRGRNSEVAHDADIYSEKASEHSLKITSILYDSFKDNREFIKINVQLYHEIKILIACMSTRLSIKGILQQLSIRSIFTNYYDSVYNYSHKKLKILMRFGWFRMILEKFVKSGPLDKMLSEDSTLTKNAPTYKESALMLLSLE